MEVDAEASCAKENEKCWVGPTMLVFEPVLVLVLVLMFELFEVEDALVGFGLELELALALVVLFFDPDPDTVAAAFFFFCFAVFSFLFCSFAKMRSSSRESMICSLDGRSLSLGMQVKKVDREKIKLEHT